MPKGGDHNAFWRAVLITAALLALVLLTSPYTFLPSLVDGWVGRGLQAQLRLQSAPEVRLESEPPYEMLAGRFSGGTIEMTGPAFGNVHPEWVRIRLAPFDLEVIRSILAGRLKTEAPISGSIRLSLSEREVQRIAASRVSAVPVDGVDLLPGRVRVRSEILLLGLRVPVAVSGAVEVRRGAIVFTPLSFSAFGVAVPEGISRSLLPQTSFVYPIRGMPLPGTFTGIEVLENRAILSGRITIPAT